MTEESIETLTLKDLDQATVTAWSEALSKKYKDRRTKNIQKKTLTRE
jgi:hypothetical protein